MRRFKVFDVQQTQCTSQADRDHLLGVVQSGFGDYLVFNRLMRSVFAKRIMRTDVDALESHEHEVLAYQKQTAFQQAVSNGSGQSAFLDIALASRRVSTALETS